MVELLALVVSVLRAGLRSRADLLAENLLLRHQLAVLTWPTRKRPRVRARDKVLWVRARRLRRDWRRHLVLVRPETVLGWHRRGRRLVWRWRSRCPLGRPRLSPEVPDAIATIARDDPLWGTERIRGELLKPGIVVSNRSVRRYRRQPRRTPDQTWRTFLRNRRPSIWAADLFTVQTLAFQTLRVRLLITHDRRELVHLAVTAHPTAAWIWRQLIEASPWGRQPRYRVRDRDKVYGGDVAARARGLGIETSLTPVRAPREAWPTLCAAEAVAAHASTYPSQRDSYGPWFRGWLDRGARVTGADYARAHALRLACAGLLRSAFAPIDALLCPAMPGPPGPVAPSELYGAAGGDDIDMSFLRFTAPFNFNGAPTLTLPCGLSDDRLPLSLQIVGRPLGEAVVCRVGQAYERATSWHTTRPPV